MLPKHILVPTDLSDGAEPAIEYACELAAKLGATVHLVNVIGVPTMGVPEIGVAVTSSMIDGLVRDNQAALDRIGERYQDRVNIGQRILKIGDAQDAIEEAAKEVGADLIVMATHGRHGVARWLLGSVAEQIIRSASCPVLTVRIAEKPEPAKEDDSQRATG